MTPGSWINYKSVNDYEKSFKKRYQKFSPDVNSEELPFIQDVKAFLNQKDQSHFDKYFNYNQNIGFDYEKA